MRKYNHKDTNISRKEKLEATLAKLEEGVRIFQNSEAFKDYLKTMSRFHNYSFNNSLLIYMQKPEATYCAGYTTWKSMGRFVKAGETGITILAPAFSKTEVEITNPDGSPVLDESGKPKTEEHVIPRYRPTTTFDYSQTEGEPLPEILTELKGDVADYEKLFGAFKTVAEDAGVGVSFEDISSGAKGYYSPAEDRIAIKNGMSQIQNVKTLVHEITHSRADNLSLKDDEELKTDRHGKETRAEACAYVVCSHFGIDCSDYSFPYLTTWATGRDLKELREQMDNIRRIASGIITDAEGILAKVPEQTKGMEIKTKEKTRAKASARCR